MNEPPRDPIEAVRRIDPVDPSLLPDPSTDARARALFEEVVSMNEQLPTGSPRPRWLIPVFAVAVAAVAVAVIAVIALSADGGSDEPPLAAETTTTTATSTTQGQGGFAMCVELYSLETLANREFAFDGTVTSIDETAVTFAVGTWFRGGDAPEVTLDGTGLTGGSISIDGGTTLVEGDRYLVSGDGGFVWTCGFTFAYDEATAADWAATVRG